MTYVTPNEDTSDVLALPAMTISDLAPATQNS